MRTEITKAVLAALPLLVSLTGCSYNPPPVLLEASPASIAELAGTWEGTYAGLESSRTGMISFTIKAGTDTAFGDVLMESPLRAPFVAADAASGAHAQHARSLDLLSIRFVAIRDGYLQGELEPYIAPDCRCTVHTIFRGRRRGEEIRGDFLTLSEYGQQTGTWSVRRVKTVAADGGSRTP